MVIYIPLLTTICYNFNAIDVYMVVNIISSILFAFCYIKLEHRKFSTFKIEHERK